MVKFWMDKIILPYDSEYPYNSLAGNIGSAPSSHIPLDTRIFDPPHAKPGDGTPTYDNIETMLIHAMDNEDIFMHIIKHSQHKPKFSKSNVILSAAHHGCPAVQQYIIANDWLYHDTDDKMHILYNLIYNTPDGPIISDKWLSYLSDDQLRDFERLIESRLQGLGILSAVELKYLVYHYNRQHPSAKKRLVDV